MLMFGESSSGIEWFCVDRQILRYKGSREDSGRGRTRRGDGSLVEESIA